MHQTDTTASFITNLRKTFMVIGFTLFIVLSLLTARSVAGQDLTSDSKTLQPELQVIATLRR